jgi:hypothetical protein
MEGEDKKEILEIIGELKCPKHFKCYKSGFENLCKARDVGIESFLECLEDVPLDCKFSISFGRAYYCQCPLRVYISKKLVR